MIHTRRKFLTGMGSLLAAPAIVHAGNLMPVKAAKLLTLEDYQVRILEPLYGRSPAMDALGDYRGLWQVRWRILAEELMPQRQSTPLILDLSSIDWSK